MNRNSVGITASLSRVITRESVEAFARLSGDANPIHIDPKYAGKTRFGRCLAHGFLVASTLSTLIATKLPGAGSIYISQDLKFLKPVFWDEEVIARATVLDRPKESVFVLETKVLNSEGAVVIDGQAVVKWEA